MPEDKINILIVDDEEQFLDFISKRLETRGFNVRTAGNGEEAIEVSRNETIDIVILDLKMPVMDGEAALEALKKEHPEMEIIILTGYGTVDTAVSCIRNGAYYYLQKPCDIEKLLEVISEAYEKFIMSRKNIKSVKEKL